MDSRRNARVVGNSARVVENASNYSAGVVRNQENASFSGESRACETCGQSLGSRSGIFGNWDGFPPGVKFDPTDEQLLHHLEAAIGKGNPHPHIGSFIPVLDGEDGICQTHPMNLPGVKQDGSSRHFFHKPAKAYTTGTRKRRKIHSEVDEPGVETRWHKTGKTRSVSENGVILGWKKIMVLYKNSGAKKSKPEKTNWILHQYHLGHTEEETDGELVVCKVFYQKQPRQCTGGRQADGVNEMENVDLNQGGSGDMSFTCRSEVSRGTAASPKVDTPQRPRSSRDRGEATGRMRGALQAQSGKGSELTVIGMETQAAVASELTSTPATYLPEAVAPARTNFAGGSYMNPSIMKTFDPTVAENYTGEWNGPCEEVSTSGKSCHYETDNQVGGGTGSTAMVEEGERNQFQGVFDESQQQLGTEDIDVGLFCKEVLVERGDFVLPGDGGNSEEFSNPHMDYEFVDLPSSFPYISEEYQFNDSQEAWAALDKAGPVLDNEDSLSST